MVSQLDHRERPASPVDDLLLRLLRCDWDAAEPPPTDIGLDTDWTPIVQTALHHGVAGLLCRSLRRVPAGQLLQEMFDAAGVFLANTDAKGAVVVAQLFDILDTLAADGIPALTFKGPALAMLAHANAAIRPSLDIDILVHRQDMDRAVAALRRLGYRLGYGLDEGLSPRAVAACHDLYGQTVMLADGRIPVEPHSAFAPRALDVNLDMNGLWDRARPVDLGGRAVLTLSPEDTLLTACLHGCKDKWWRLLWVADIAAFIHRHPALDFAAPMERAERAGVRRMFLLGLALARDLFSTTLPVAICSAMDHDPTCLRLMQRSKENLFGAQTDLGSQNRVSLYHLRSRERFGDRVRYVWRTVTTPRVIHFRMIKLPDSLFFGYVAVKLVHDYLLLPVWHLGKGRWWRRTPSGIPDTPA